MYSSYRPKDKELNRKENDLSKTPNVTAHWFKLIESSCDSAVRKNFVKIFIEFQSYEIKIGSS